MTTTTTQFTPSEAAYFQADEDGHQILAELERLGGAPEHAQARAGAYDRLAATERTAWFNVGALYDRRRDAAAARAWHADAAWTYDLLALVERTAPHTAAALKQPQWPAIGEHIATRTSDSTVRAIVRVMTAYGIDPDQLAHLHAALTHSRVGMRGEAVDGVVTRLPQVYMDRTG